ncbi:MAG: alginate lyase family protein [Armatimonadetes bacterium]|nr:alginate lyase family protein [Armatimonadota bacterium]
MQVTHPNLFLNRTEIEAIREKIRRHEWAGRLHERLLAQVEDTLRGGSEYALYYTQGVYPGVGINALWITGRRVRDVALAAAIANEQRYADKARELLLFFVDAAAQKPPPLDSLINGARDPEANLWALTHVYDQLSPSDKRWVDSFLVFGLRGGINLCWAYDLIHERLSEAEREAIEGFFLWIARSAMVPLAEHPSPHNRTMWGRAFCGVVGYTVGDRELIQFALEAPGGLKDVLERGTRDGGVWNEANPYQMFYVSQLMAILAEAALRGDGVDLWHWRSPGGNSMKRFYDVCLHLAFPVELRVATYGDNGTQSPFVAKGALYGGHQIGDYFLANDRDGRDWNTYELAYLRYRDPAYAWVLAQNPERDSFDQAVWGYLGLTHGVPLPERIDPPPAPSTLYPQTGLAMLRADESPAYWTSGSPAVSIRFGATRGVSHAHMDPFHITLHGKGHLVYPDWFIQWDYTTRMDGRRGKSPTPWSMWPAAHNTLLVDKKAEVALPQPLPVAEHDFGAAVKVIRIRGSIYPGVEQTRTLALTGEYLLDLFEARSESEHTYDWILHGLGELAVPFPWRFSPFDIGADLGFGVIDTGAPADDPENRWMRNGMQAVVPETWSATWRQKEGDAWVRAPGAGVCVTMLGAPGTTLYRADGPYYVSGAGLREMPTDGKARSVPLLIARRRARNTLFVALHEPYDDPRGLQIQLRRIRASEGILAVEIRTGSGTDYFFYAESLPGPHRVESEIGVFRLRGGCGYIRRDSRGTTTRGIDERDTRD